MNVRIALVAEGSTDAALLRILRWAVRCDSRVQEIESHFVHPSELPRPREGLAVKIARALDLFPSDLLFVHRDADSAGVDERRDEIRRALSDSGRTQVMVPVVPLRMTEAWLLIDEHAIRRAAGNPAGTIALDLPRLRAIESRADPKEVLYRALRDASELSGRRAKKFDVVSAAALVPEFIRDFVPLRQLTAFRSFETDLTCALDSLNR